MATTATALLANQRRRLIHSPLRPLLRRIGLGHLLHLVATLRVLPYELRYRKRCPTGARVRLRGLTATFGVTSPSELQRVLTIGGERDILDRLLREVRSGDVVYDVGTNLGVFTVMLARAIGPTGLVIGFEPEPRARQRAHENLARNGLQNVRILPVALGNEAGEIDLFIDEAAASGEHSILKRTASGRALRIPLARGDELIPAEQLPRPNVIKIDVEGFEHEVLLGLASTLRDPACRVVLCEVHFSILHGQGKPNVPLEIEGMLRKAGFDYLDWVNPSHLLAVKR